MDIRLNGPLALLRNQFYELTLPGIPKPVSQNFRLQNRSKGKRVLPRGNEFPALVRVSFLFVLVFSLLVSCVFAAPRAFSMHVLLRIKKTFALVAKEKILIINMDLYVSGWGEQN